jgi:cytoskeletal protein CcmA (bactofilin family)
MITRHRVHRGTGIAGKWQSEGHSMFNRDGIFGKKEGNVRNDSRGNVNVTPGLGPAPAKPLPEAPPERQAQDAAKAAPRTDEGKGSKLIVGPDIKLKGVEITDCDTLVVEGRVEASMDSRVINIAERGVFAGTVGIDMAEIHGRFEGELTARKQLVIRSTGKVSGKIRYGKITIEEGGELSGDVSALNPSTPGAVTKSTGDAAHHDIMSPYDPFGRGKARPGQPASAS